ncbi:insulin-like growth factor-binding protein 2-A isoform X1 [Lepisosteus oculatus]|uniref:Insulin-like growth factor binding protein 2b n=1 Tax=Lepisosteus oculatus TaxID=7918 RepID=W5MS99_LEPOC|nr:PREDICTED: insulin-like growth factor-binding protein 2 isoform X1 [Lepisosteus oculatus]
MVSLFGSILLLASVAFSGTVLGDLVFRCPVCSAERQADCPKLVTTCLEIVREHGCGCCPVCARLEGESCGVYTPRCSSGLRCYPKPDSDLPLEELVKGSGTCGRRVDGEGTGSQEHGTGSAEMVDHSEVSLTDHQPEERSTNGQWLSPKDIAVRQHTKGLSLKMHTGNRLQDEPKRPRLKPSQCQQELDRVLERISKMPFSDERGPLEYLYALHIPNCDKQGLYNLKQCKMSVNGQRGECWCVNQHTGKPIPGSPVVRGDPSCKQYITGLQTQPPMASQK